MRPADRARLRGQSAASCFAEFRACRQGWISCVAHVLACKQRNPFSTRQQEQEICNTVEGGLCFVFFKARRCSRFMHLSRRSHRGMLIFALSVFQPVCACVSGESRGWFTPPGGQALAHFLFLSCVLCQGSLCHQLSACQRWILLFQSTDQLTFHLSLLHLPPQHARKRQEVGRSCSACPRPSLTPPLFLPTCSVSKPRCTVRKTCLLISVSFCVFLCSIRRRRCFNNEQMCFLKRAALLS